MSPDTDLQRYGRIAAVNGGAGTLQTTQPAYRACIAGMDPVGRRPPPCVHQSVDRDLGLLDYCRIKGIMLQAWSPFQKRFFDGVFLGDR